MPKSQKFLYDRGFIQRKPAFFVLLCIDVVLRGVAQVFLCNHPICGIFVLIGLGFTSIKLALYALLGTFFSTFSAVTVARPPEADILAGLCGYDGALVGCACLTFFGGVDETIAATVLLSFLAGIVHVAVTNLMKMWQLPSFTFAFNIVTIMIIFAVKGDNVKLRFAKSAAVHHSPNWTDMSLLFAVDASIRGVGQFMFADTTVGSSFVVAGIALCSRKGAAIALLGSIVGWVTAFYILDTTNRVNIRSGLYGYNCAGTCCVLAGGIFYRASDGAIVVGICGAALAALLHQGMSGLFGGQPVLTFPFITSAWILMLCRSKWLDMESDGILRPVLKRMATSKLAMKMKPRLNAATADPIARLRSRLQGSASANQLTKRKSSAKIAVAPLSSSSSVKDFSATTDLEQGQADDTTTEQGAELFVAQESTSTTSMKVRSKSISFKNVAKALVDINREIKEERQDLEQRFGLDEVEDDD